jgi:hypothetical protein
MRLRDRGKFPPGGYRWYCPQTNFSITPWVSFDVAVGQIIANRQGNPHLTAVNSWSVDPTTVGNELDEFNTKVCQQMGWKDFITDGGPDPGPPKAPSLLSRLAQSAAHVAGGIETIREWDIEGGQLVPQEVSEKRALVCTTCPKNGMGDLSSWFTVPAADLIRKKLEARNHQKIHTTQDPLLGVCEACACPLKLKVHCPIDIIKSKMADEVRQALWPACWILSEA